MEASRMEMVFEASERLAILEGRGLSPKVRTDFEDGRIAFLAPAMTPRLAEALQSEPKLLAIALAGVEQIAGSVAYLASVLVTSEGEWASALAVRPDSRLWPQERAMLTQGFHVAFSMNVETFERRLHSVKVEVLASGAVEFTDISDDVERHWKQRMG